VVDDREVAVGYIGGAEQGRFVERIRNAERERLLAAPIDVGKRTASRKRLRHRRDILNQAA
jgi:hypothetical protein